MKNKLIIALVLIGGLYGCKKDEVKKLYNCRLVVQGFRSDVVWYKVGHYYNEWGQIREQVDEMVFYSGDTSSLGVYGGKQSTVKLMVDDKEVMKVNSRDGLKYYIFK